MYEGNCLVGHQKSSQMLSSLNPNKTLKSGSGGKVNWGPESKDKHTRNVRREEMLPASQHPWSPWASCRAQSPKPPWPSACRRWPDGKHSTSPLAEGPAGRNTETRLFTKQENERFILTTDSTTSITRCEITRDDLFTCSDWAEHSFQQIQLSDTQMNRLSRLNITD